VRTDLAIESGPVDEEQSGVEITRETFVGGNITRVRVLNEQGAQRFNKPPGLYITLECQSIAEEDADLRHEVSQQIAKELENLWPISTRAAHRAATILVVGLGNWHVTPDALGPKVVQELLVTRHLLEHAAQGLDEGLQSVCAIAPGVLGLTGIETGEIILGIVEKVRPHMVIAVDALASRSVERVGTTVQMTDTGISPGSGIGNKRKALTRETLGVPVIAIGVPTVVYAATIAREAVEQALAAMVGLSHAEGAGARRPTLSKEMRQDLLQNILSPHAENLVVTPKEIDSIINNMSKVIAGGLNAGLHPNLYLGEALS